MSLIGLGASGFCQPCEPEPRNKFELEEIDEALPFFSRALSDRSSPLEAWNLAASVVECNTSHIAHGHLVAAQNTLLALIVAQHNDTDRKATATKLLQHLSTVAQATAEDDPCPDCSETELLLALYEDEDGKWGLPGVTVVSFHPGQQVQDDVTVIDEQLDAQEVPATTPPVI